jgi:transposase
MEDVLSVYTRPADPERPLICMDEKPLQFLGEVRPPLPLSPGQPVREDYEYQRNGTTNLFILFAPRSGWRHIEVTERRTKQDWAHLVRELVDVHYPKADRIVLVMDNLNTHSPASLYETFEPSEARRLTEKLEIHFTPKHGSWLNMAEIELSLLSKQCLDRRIPDPETLRREVEAWEERRNASQARVDWRFTTADARVKLKRLYPSIQT